MLFIFIPKEVIQLLIRARNHAAGIDDMGNAAMVRRSDGVTMEKYGKKTSARKTE